MDMDPVSVATFALFVYFAQKHLKGTQLYAAFVRAMPGADKWAHRLVGGVGAIFAALGVHLVYMYDINLGGSATVTLPSGPAVWHAAQDWIVLFTAQQGVYELAKPPMYAAPPAPKKE